MLLISFLNIFERQDMRLIHFIRVAFCWADPIHLLMTSTG